MKNPFSVHPPNHATTKCACGSTCLVATSPSIEDEPTPVRMLLPDREIVMEGMAIANAMRGGRNGTREAQIIAALLDAYVIHAELLSRVLTGMRYGTGDAQYDEELSSEALSIAEDVLRCGLRDADAPDTVPREIEIDIQTWLTDAGFDDMDEPVHTNIEA